MPAIVWGTQAGLLVALSMGFQKAMVETDNREAYDTLHIQEFIFLPPDLEDAFGQFNTLFNNQFQENITERKVSVILLEYNGTAQYMASYGMEKMQELVLAPGHFGDIHHYLQRDMGMILPFPQFELLENFGEGEVLDPSPPLSPVEARKTQF